ncbi:hypothetical protein [Candidatus Nitrotoga sp. HW29]|uniref:hypothetical protein n=1 Tax=Candidatus Nitrotoga sp. HW29 TaxID=2886963 RepID=UPI001EF1D7FF|nr:hypothetical protein [Candidatus Nitrotoga sp. HW29]
MQDSIPSQCDPIIPNNNPMIVRWIVIPKGLSEIQGQTNIKSLSLTVMPVLDQSTFVWNGPFDKNATYRNWATWVKKSLLGLKISISPLNGQCTDDTSCVYPVNFSEEMRNKIIMDQLWDTFFNGSRAGQDVSPSSTISSAAAAELIALDQTSVFAKTSQEIIKHLISMHMSRSINGANRNGNMRPPSVRIDQLFSPSGQTNEDQPILSGPDCSRPSCWEDNLKKGYSQISDIFLPVKPSLSRLFAAQTASPQYNTNEVGDERSLTNDLLDSLKNIESVYRAVPALSHESMKTYMSKGMDRQPIFTAEAVGSMLEGFKKVFSSRDKYNTRNDPTVKKLDHPWANVAVQHMITTIPYVANKKVIAKMARVDSSKSPKQRLAMLMAEPGLLSSIGLLFDVEIPIESHQAIGDEFRISVSANWKTCPAFLEQCPKTVITEKGVPKAKESVFDEQGFLNLGARNEQGEPQFVLTDFRFDEALRHLQNGAHADRNQLPEYSPGANALLLPAFQFSEILSHDLALHWVNRRDAAVNRKEFKENDDLYLDNLAIGIRPHLGRLSDDDSKKINWFDLAGKHVTYDALKGKARTSRDIARDDSYAPLVSYDKLETGKSRVAELMCTWNGWGLGLPLPGTKSTKHQFPKKESARPRSFPPFRYGDSVCMAARLVLRDGSCLLSANEAASKLGANWPESEEGSPLIVGSREESVSKPFRLLRWERLRAPAILHDKPPRQHKWWPPESASRAVVATSHQHGLENHSVSFRFVVPDKEPDMFSTWKHGMFNKTVDPKETAFPNATMDNEANFIPVRLSYGDRTEPAFEENSVFGSPRSIPYHPDPLVTQIHIWAVRRLHANSTEWVPIGNTDGTEVCVKFNVYHSSHWPAANALHIQVIAEKRKKPGPLLVLHEKINVLKVHVPEGESMTLVFAPAGDEATISKKHAFGLKRCKQMLTKFFVESKLHLLSSNLYPKYSSCLPFLANTSMLDIEHVVDQPAFRPTLQLVGEQKEGTIELSRSPDQTIQDIEIEVKFDPGSTGAVEIYASWIEREGNLKRLIEAQEKKGKTNWENSFPRLVAKFDHKDMEKDLIHSMPATTPVIRDPSSKNWKFKHEFNDCKHRKVSYWARGISSVSAQIDEATHRKVDNEFAAPTLVEGHDTALRDLTNPVPSVAHILASRMPKVPSLRYIVPAFSFRTEKSKHKVRRMRSSLLCLHMDGDWWDSGEDEMLAVVLIDPTKVSGSFEDVQEKYSQLASFWGADPTKQSEQNLSRLPNFMGPQHFIETATPHKLTYPKKNKSGQIEYVTAYLSLALFKPKFCMDAGSWRVEIPLVNPSAVSRPFVRFAFARYQKYALPDLQLSDIVVADYAQLSDEREAVIMCDPTNNNLIRVTVYGISFQGLERSGEARVACWLERRCTPLHDGVAAWIPESEPKPLSRTVREGRACWHGELPSAESSRSNNYRVAIVEEEYYLRDKKNKEYGAIPIYFDLVPVREID